MSKILVAPDDLSGFICAALERKGARREDGAVVAEGLVWANLRGVDGHGVSRLPFYLRMIERSDWVGAASYAIGSMIAGLVAVLIGMMLAKRVFG